MSKIYKIIITFFLLIFPTSLNAHVEHYEKLNSIEFDIYRNNKNIGKHIFSFNRSGDQLTVSSEINFEIKKLIKFTKSILNASIKYGGSSIKDFSSSNGKKGSFQQHFKVYGRAKESCSNTNCKSKIVRIVISNRATFYCRKCQK